MPTPRKIIDVPQLDLGFLRGLAKSWIAILFVLIVVWLAFSSFYTVPPDSRGVVLRLGKPAGVRPPGLHFKLPFGIDQVIKVATERQQKLEFGFKATTGYTNRYQGSEQPDLEREMITGDLNAALVEWSVQYRVGDPEFFLFHVREPEATLRDLSESVVREVVGDRTVDEVITTGRQEIESACLLRLRDLTTQYELGVTIEQVQLRDVNPPREVQGSFSEVNQAQQDRERLINVANGEYNQAVPRAKGEADQKIRGAEGYRFKRINEASGDVASFTALLSEYLKAPDVTRARIYQESMAEVLASSGPKVIVDESLRTVWPLLMPARSGAAPVQQAPTQQQKP